MARTLTTDHLEEIFKAFIRAEVLPSESQLKAFSKLSGKSVEVLKDDYAALHHEQTGEGENPFMPPPPMRG